MKRALNVADVINHNPRVRQLSDKFSATLGDVELKGSWIVWGNSGNGKTRFALQLAKELSKYARVAYNSLEEGLSGTIQMAFMQEKMQEAKGLLLLDSEKIPELEKRLKKHKSPGVVIVDSFQYARFNYALYSEFRQRFPRKLFIWISHAEGNEPAGRVAKSVRYDASVKVRVEGFKAFPMSRYGGGEPYVIWDEGARRYWGRKGGGDDQ